MSGKNNLRVVVLKDSAEVVKLAADILCEGLREAGRRRKSFNLGLATGRTMIPFYAELVERHERSGLSFRNVKTFNLDEYCELGEDAPQSFRAFMNKHFFNKVDMKEENIYFLRGDAEKFSEECKRFEFVIKKAGGIDLQFLGIGRNGHIGFNEPGSSFKSRTRRVKLSDSTRRANSAFFSSLRAVPSHALTIGVGTIFEAKKIVLLATGKEKAFAVDKSLHSPASAKIPASALRMHRDATFLLDRAAASGMQMFK